MRLQDWVGASGAAAGSPKANRAWGLALPSGVAGLAIASAAFTLYGMLALWRVGHDCSAQQGVERRLDVLLSTLKDAEAGQRGYLLTADRAFLKPCAHALQVLPAETAELARSMAALQPERGRLLASMTGLIDDKTREMARTIALADDGQQAAALSLLRSDAARRTMDRLRALNGLLQADFDASFSANTARQRTLASLSAATLMLTLSSTLFLVVMLRRLQRHATLTRQQWQRVARQRAQAEAATEQAQQRRLAAEDKLVISELHLSATLASIGAGFMATDRAGRVLRMNAVAEQIPGWTQAESQGRSLWQVLDPDAQPGAHGVHGAATATDRLAALAGSAGAVPHMATTPGGGRQSAVEVRTRLALREDGSLQGAVLVFRDASREQRAEAEAARLAAIVDSCTDAVIGKTLDGRISSWNRAAQALFGYSAEEAIGQPVQMLIPQDRADEEMRILAHITRGDSMPAFDTVRRTKRGELVPVSVAISPIRDAQQRIVGASKIARDITRSRDAERALRISQERMRFALDAAQIGHWDLDLQTGQAACSLQHDRCFGYDAPQPDWCLERFEQHLHPQDRVEALRLFRAAVAGQADWTMECRVVWSDTSIHWIRIHGSRLDDSEGSECAAGGTHMLGIVSDITAHKQAEAARIRTLQLEAQNRQFQEATRVKSEFLANMSHELRTPLNAIIGFADLLHAGAVKHDPRNEQVFLGNIRSSGRHLLQLINDVLDLAKVESGKFEFFPESVDLATLVREVGDILQTLLQAKHLRLAVDVDPALGPVMVDASRLKQALYNYLSNAIKFSAERGLIELRASAAGASRFRIEVEDHGIGIAAADIPRLFTDFQQLDGGSSKLHQGTGLGLALTRRLVQAQGGTVSVRSTLGQGSVFDLVLSRAPRQLELPCSSPGPAPALRHPPAAHAGSATLAGP